MLVTGVSRDLGAGFARQVAADPAVQRVVGVDATPPRGDLGAAHFVRADIRNPVIAKVLVGEDVDTVVHLSVHSAGAAGGAGPDGGAGRSATKEHNVIGTMQLLAAAAKAPGVRRLVVRSSAAVYGSSSRDPAMFTEEMSARRQPRTGFAKDVLDVEGYVRGFARRRPDVAVTLLRTATTIGAGVTSPLADYLRLPVVPTVLGYDARLQFLHGSDLLAALHLAVLGGAQGTFNLAGDGIMLLSQAVRRLGRPMIALPPVALRGAGQLSRRNGAHPIDAELTDLLSFGRALDTTRMRTVLGFRPAYDTAAAFADLVHSLRPGLLARAGEPRVRSAANLGHGRG